MKPARELVLARPAETNSPANRQPGAAISPPAVAGLAAQHQVGSAAFARPSPPGEPVDIAESAPWLIMPKRGSLERARDPCGQAQDSPAATCAAKDIDMMPSGDPILPAIMSNVSKHLSKPQANPLKAWMEPHAKFLSTLEDTALRKRGSRRAKLALVQPRV